VTSLGAEIEAFAARARSRLRAEPPGPFERRSDLRGDHSHEGGDWLGLVGRSPPREAAVLVPVVARAAGPTVLLTRRALNLRQHSGQIAFPGGRVDPEDGSPLVTAFREAEEEIGLDRATLQPLGFLDPYLSGTNYLVVPAVALVPGEPQLRVNREEVDHAFEVPLAFLMDAANHELHAGSWRGRVRQYYAMPYGDHYIWGVTAGILRNLYERLYAP